MRIGILGAGNIGRGLALHLIAARHEVMLSYRHERAELTELARKLGSRVGAVHVTVRFGEIVVLAVPWDQIPAVLQQAGSLEGRILWDCTNPMAPDLSGLVVGTTTSGGEMVAKQAIGARVVKAIPPFAEILNGASLPNGSAKPAVFLCSDDGDSKRQVAALVAAIGAEPIDAGPLRNARYAEPSGMLLVQLAYERRMGGCIGMSLVRYG